jgi:hypothetical protein
MRLKTGPAATIAMRFGQALVRKRPLDVRLVDLFIGILADHLHVAAERKRAQRVFRLADLFFPELGTKAHRESEHADAGQLGE